jgi:hypothetical protein
LLLPPQACLAACHPRESPPAACKATGNRSRLMCMLVTRTRSTKHSKQFSASGVITCSMCTVCNSTIHDIELTQLLEVVQPAMQQPLYSQALDWYASSFGGSVANRGLHMCWQRKAIRLQCTTA